jgi:hypothetical protein
MPPKEEKCVNTGVCAHAGVCMHTEFGSRVRVLTGTYIGEVGRILRSGGGAQGMYEVDMGRGRGV